MEQERNLPTSRWIRGAIGLTALAGLIYLISLPGRAEQTPEVAAGSDSQADRLETAPVRGALAPEFSLKNLDGEQVTLSELRGHPILINFWATWCAPCRIEMPAMQDRFERYKDQGFVVLAVDFDEPPSAVEAFRDELGLTFDLLLDPGAEVQELYRNRSYPTSFFVDAAGVIQVHHIGVMTEGQLDEHLGAIGLGG